MARDYRRKTDSLPTCMNCGSVLYGLYCSHCGQRTTEAITLETLWSDSWRKLTGLESPWLRTLADLTLDPGRTVRRYLDGRRLPYVGPFRFALFTAGLLAAAAWFLGFDLSASATPWGPDGARGPGPAGSYAIFAWSAFMGPVASLLVAWLQHSLFRDHRFTVAETWIFDLYVFGQVAFYQVFFGLLGAYASAVGLGALGLVVLLVLAFALGGFYRRPVIHCLPAALILTVTQVGGVFVLGTLVRLLAGI
ncbi:MAG: DUF3667 domain-containing protein [Holophagales bacterium]|nr:DUF3667 domain-containing protein [Holophagales bacterium]